MRRKIILATMIVFAMHAVAANAHGVVGDYVFLEPLITEDPTPANELDILEPSWVKSSDANDYSIGFSGEKVLWIDDNYQPRFSLAGGTAWHHVSPFEGPSHEGVDNPEVAAKWAFYYSLEHEFLTSIALVADLPVGNKDIRNQSHTSLGPEFLWEKALGDLPNLPVLKYLRPLGFQGDLGYLPALGGQTSHDLFADAVVEYSIPYLSNSVEDIGLKWPFRNLFVFSEFNYDQLVKGPSGQTFPTFMATPGIAYVSYHYELSVGTQLALNNAAVPANHATIIALLDIFYDSFFPKWGNWTINRGPGQ
ncbi:hypothetical protein [Candidatus Binatus sp.]|uniref:hypothetical protein n=1 Tax=Candidatus Binatus sp. TaxID=2811406 RepID=UPI003BB1699B